MTPTPPPDTAALVIIGNEILSGKITDTNGAWLLKELRSLGVETTRVEIVPDEEALIVDAIHRCQRHASHLFTSGGIGTTHDDVTVPAIAKALGKKVVHAPEIVAMLRGHWGDRVDAVKLRLAEIPEGAELVAGGAGTIGLPVILADGILILPGVPELFRSKFEAVRERYRARPIALVNLYLDVSEPDIADTLTEATRRFQGIAIGSYPRFDDADHRVRITIESRDAALVDACAKFLREAFSTVFLRETRG